MACSEKYCGVRTTSLLYVYLGIILCALVSFHVFRGRGFVVMGHLNISF